MLSPLTGIPPEILILMVACSIVCFIGFYLIHEKISSGLRKWRFWRLYNERKEQERRINNGELEDFPVISRPQLLNEKELMRREINNRRLQFFCLIIMGILAILLLIFIPWGK